MSGEVITSRAPSSGKAAAPAVALAVLGAVLLLALGCLVAAPLVAPEQPGWAWLIGAIGVAVALWVLDVVATLLTRRGRVRLRLLEGAAVVVGSPWSRPVDVAAPVVFVVALVGGVLTLVGTAPDAPATPGLDAAAPVAVLAVLAFLALLGLLGVLRRRRVRSALRLDLDGLEVSGPQGRGEFEWDALTGAREMPLAVQTVTGSWVTLPASELRSDPALVARLVEHYRTRRSDRVELTDGRVVQRVREDRLAPLEGAAP